MKPVANRVRASVPWRTVTSTSASRARAWTRSTVCSASASARADSSSGAATTSMERSVVVIALAPHPDADPTEARRHGGVAGVADLLRLALATVRRAPERPFVAVPEHVERAPEPRADRGVGRVLEEPRLLAALDLPADLAAELEVQPLVVDRPRAVRVHQDPVVGRGDHRLEGVRAGQEPDVRHPDHRDPVEAVGADGAAGALDAGQGGGVATRQRADPDPVLDDVDRVGGRALVIEAEAAERAWQGRIGGHVHQLRPEPQRTQLPQLQPRRPGECRLPAEDPVELGGVPDRLVDLERHLLAAEDQVGRIQRRAGVRRQELPRLFGDPNGVAGEVQLADQLPAARAVLAADARIAPALRLALADRRRAHRGAGLD